MDFYITSGVKVSASKKLWIGDLSFLFSLEEWGRFYQLLQSNEQVRNLGTVLIKNKSFVYWKAVNGSDIYPLYQSGKEIGKCNIMSGIICIIPHKLVKRVFKGAKKGWKNRGHIIYRRPYHPIINSGNCQWGDYELYTGDYDPNKEELGPL